MIFQQLNPFGFVGLIDWLQAQISLLL